MHGLIAELKDERTNRVTLSSPYISMYTHWPAYRMYPSRSGHLGTLYENVIMISFPSLTPPTHSLLLVLRVLHRAIWPYSGSAHVALLCVLAKMFCFVANFYSSLSHLRGTRD